MPMSGVYFNALSNEVILTVMIIIVVLDRNCAPGKLLEYPHKFPSFF